MSIANIVIGPVIIAIIFGFIVGSRVHLNLDNSFKFTASGILALIIGEDNSLFIMICQLQPPFWERSLAY